MKKYLVVLLPIMASCSVVKNSDAKDSQPGLLNNSDHNESDPNISNNFSLKECAISKIRSLYLDLILSSKNPTQVDKDIMQYINEGDALIFVNTNNHIALLIKEATKIWNSGERIYGREEEAFRSCPKFLTIFQQTKAPIPWMYKEKISSSIAITIDEMLKNPKFSELNRVLEGFEEGINKDYKMNSKYSDRMSCLKRLLANHFNDIDQGFYDLYKCIRLTKDTEDNILYAKPYNESKYWDMVDSLIELATKSNSYPVVNEYVSFLKKDEHNFSIKNDEISHLITYDYLPLLLDLIKNGYVQESNGYPFICTNAIRKEVFDKLCQFPPLTSTQISTCQEKRYLAAIRSMPNFSQA